MEKIGISFILSLCGFLFDIYMNNKQICDSKNKDFHRFTKRCIKKCDIEKNDTFIARAKAGS